MSHVCNICGKAFATLNGVSGHMRIHSASSMSHVCKICGKKFATSKALSNHKRIHSGKRNRMEDENEILFLLWIWGLGFPLSLKESSSMTEIEQDEMNEAAMSLVMFSEQVYDFAAAFRNLPPPPLGDSSMDLELKPMQENILHCVESKLDFSELVSHSKSSTCSDGVAYADVVPSSMTSELQRKPESKSSYKCKICGKSFVCSQALGSHQRVHKSIKGRLARKKEDFEVSQEELTEVRDTTVKEHCVESKEEFGELLPSLLRCKLQEKTKSNSSRKCRICGNTFGCYQALGGHQRLHRGQLTRKREDLEGGNSLSGLSEAKKIVSEPSSFEVSQAELTELVDTNVKENCVEAKQEFSEMLKSSTCSDVVAPALQSPVRSKLQDKPESNSSYRCQICGKMLECFQGLGGHQRLHRGQLVRKREDFEGGNSLSALSEAKKIVSEPSSFEVSQEKLIELANTNVKENCVESKQDFSEVDFEKSSDVFVAQALLPSPLRSKLQQKPASNSSRVCRICGKTFWCYQALGGHQRIHRSQIARERMLFEDGNSLSDSLEAKKFFSQESSFEILM